MAVDASICSVKPPDSEDIEFSTTSTASSSETFSMISSAFLQEETRINTVKITAVKALKINVDFMFLKFFGETNFSGQRKNHPTDQ